MEALYTVTEGSSSAESLAYRAMLVAARSYVAVLVLVSLAAVVGTALGSQAQIINSSTSMTGLSPGDMLFSGGGEIPYVGLPAVWLAEDQTWFTAWVIVTMIASMLSIPGPIRAFVGSSRRGDVTEDSHQRPGVNRRLVAISAWPLLLLLLVTLPLA